MKENLKESRYRHSLGVEDMAVRLAATWGADIEKARFAGRYHDIAKNFDQERMDSCVRKYGLPEELNFVADAVEDNRTYNDLKYYQQLAETDLDRACFEILEYTIWYLESKERNIHKDTIEAREWVWKKIKGDN